MKKLVLSLATILLLSAATFAQQSCGTVKDYDGNTYNTVQLGSQCWMAENLRTTHYSDGTSIPQGDSLSETTAYRYYPDDNSSNVDLYGYLYNWPAVMHGSSSSERNPSGVQGICPTGWHVPGYAEWMQLTDYVSSQSEYVCGSDNSYIAKSLASNTGWNSSSDTCDVGNMPSSNNATGFSVVPAGFYYGGFYGFGGYAYLWSATQDLSSSAYAWAFGYYFDLVGRGSHNKDNGFSVRCIRDAGIAGAPANNESGGAGNAGGNSECCNELGARLDSLENVISSQDSVINALNNELHPPFDCGNATVTDHEGNVYNTVQIGNQCWTKENMRCTTSPSTGTTILEATPSSYSFTGKKAYYVNGSSSNTSTYGLLYNWNAAVDTFNTAYGETNTNTDYNNAVIVTFSGNRRGICPQGWHVPSDAEWTTMTDYVKSQSEYVCPGCSGTDDEWTTFCIAKALASTTGWISGTNTCDVGNMPSSNNATGFSAVPAGNYYGSHYNFGNGAYFWSAAQYSSYDAYIRYLYYYNAYVSRDNDGKDMGFSVRCVRD